MTYRLCKRRRCRFCRPLIIKKYIFIKKPCPDGECICPCQGNLVQNPGFEDFVPNTTLDLPGNWQTDFSADDIVPPANAGDIHSGLGSVVFQLTEGRDEANLYQDVTVQPGCCYDFQFWAKGQTGGGPAAAGLTAEVVYRDGQGNTLTTPITIQVQPGSLDSNSFGSYRAIAAPAPENAASARVLFTVQGSGKSLRLDDVILTVAGCGNE